MSLKAFVSHFDAAVCPRRFYWISQKLSLQKIMALQFFFKTLRAKINNLWRKPRTFMQNMWVFSTPNSVLLTINVSIQVDSCLVRTKLPNTRTHSLPKPWSHWSYFILAAVPWSWSCCKYLNRKGLTFRSCVFRHQLDTNRLSLIGFASTMLQYLVCWRPNVFSVAILHFFPKIFTYLTIVV